MRTNQTPRPFFSKILAVANASALLLASGPLPAAAQQLAARPLAARAIAAPAAPLAARPAAPAPLASRSASAPLRAPLAARAAAPAAPLAAASAASVAGSELSPRQRRIQSKAARRAVKAQGAAASAAAVRDAGLMSALVSRMIRRDASAQAPASALVRPSQSAIEEVEMVSRLAREAEQRDAAGARQYGTVAFDRAGDAVGQDAPVATKWRQRFDSGLSRPESRQPGSVLFSAAPAPARSTTVFGRIFESAKTRVAAAAVSMLTLTPAVASAQYGFMGSFGQNQTHYNNRTIRVITTDHFHVYFDKGMEQAAQIYAHAAEEWYARHSEFMGHKFIHDSGPNKGKAYKLPIILDTGDSEFWESRAIPGLGEGIGGVTEPFQERIEMPLTPNFARGIKTLGHEQSHQFHYDIAGMKMGYIPGWFEEGQAEHNSLKLEGHGIDVPTAMWLREMALDGTLLPRGDIREVELDFTAYRIGQAFWQFIDEKYGPEKVNEIFLRAVGRYENNPNLKTAAAAKLKETVGMPVDMNTAFQQATGKSLRQLSLEFKVDVMRIELPKIAQHEYAREFATPIVGPDKDGTMDIAQAVSPDGKKVAFFSGGRDLLPGVYVGSIEKLADDTGMAPNKPVRVAELGRDDKQDSFRELYAQLSWSPASNEVAWAGFSKLRPVINVLTIGEKDAPEAAAGTFDEGAREQARKKQEEQKKKAAEQSKLGHKPQKEQVMFAKSLRQIKLPAQIDDVNGAVFSPDGKQFAFVGMSKGFSNLYLINADGTGLRQLTNDIYSDLHPAWSPDGKKIAWATDASDKADFGHLKFTPRRIAIMNVATGERTYLPDAVMAGENVNPQFSPDGKDLAFVSDRTGAPNIFNYNLETGKLTQLTDVLSGVTSFAEDSPSFVWANRKGDDDFIVFNTMEHGGLALYQLTDPRGQAFEPRANYYPQQYGTAIIPGERRVTPADGANVGKYEGVVLWKPATKDSPEGAVTVKDGKIAGGAQAAPAAGQNGQAGAATAQTSGLVGPDGAPVSSQPADPNAAYPESEYRAKLKMNFSQSTPFSYGSGSGFFQQAVMNMSDVMGYHDLTIFVAGQLQSNISNEDIVVSYTNQKRPIAWGVSGFQISTLNNFGFQGVIGPQNGPKYRGASFFAMKPIDKFKRWEVSLQAMNFQNQQIQPLDTAGQNYVVIPSPSLNFVMPKASFVIDKTLSSLWGPFDGYRLRADLGHSYGDLSFNQSTIDAEYFKGTPFARLAVRGVAGSMDGRDAQFFYLGGPYTIRGYQYGQIIGNKMAMLNAEVDFPLIPIMVLNAPFPQLSQVMMGGFVDMARTSVSNPGMADYLNGSGFYTNKPVGSYGLAFKTIVMGLPLEFDWYKKIPFAATRDQDALFEYYVPDQYKSHGWMISIKIPGIF